MRSSLQDHTYFSIYIEADPSISYSSLFNDISKLQNATSAFQSSQGPLTAPVGPSTSAPVGTPTSAPVGTPTRPKGLRAPERPLV